MKKTHLLIFIAIFHIVNAIEDILQIKTNKGIVKGTYRNTINGKQILAFTGIPYAKQPVGELRFKLAVESEPWDGILDATKPHAICPQINVLFNDYDVKGQEDCLYLNIFTPENARNSKKPLPVLFYIHGGGFMFGTGNTYAYGPDMLLDKDVILVTSNYRLGALGFLSTGDKMLPGNNGLKDQSFALKWVKDNVASFGGDPNKITIFGQSAGGASVHFHVLSPRSKGLFVGAIAHSGSALALWAVAPGDQAVRNAKKLGRLLNCSTDSSEELIDCLSKVDAYDIVQQDKAFMEFSFHPAIPFKPTIEPDIENAFLTKHPIEIIKSGNVSPVPLMFGITTEDGAVASGGLYNNSQLLKQMDKEVYKILPLLHQYHQLPQKDQDHITSKIREFYFLNGSIDSTTKAELTDLFTDSWFFYPQNIAARLHAKYTKQNIYYFVYGYKGSISFGPFFGNPNDDFGVCHGDDISYILSGDLFKNYKLTEADKKINDLLTTMWLNFAKTGNPTPDVDGIIKTKWVPITNQEKLSYYFIKNEVDCEVVENMYPERNAFWEGLPLFFTSGAFKDEL